VCNAVYSQDKQVGVSNTRTYTETLDVSKVYNKNTGLKVTQDELHKLIQNNPHLLLEREYDAAGNISRILYKDEILQGFDLENSNFKFVANGQNFIQKYGISNFPSTLLIDQSGKFIENYDHLELIDLGEFLGK